MVYSIVGNGWTVWSWGTTRDTAGIVLKLDSNTVSCVLNGVAGDLSRGQEIDQNKCGLAAERTETGVWPFIDGWHITAHGAQCAGIWSDNPVVAQATCFWESSKILDGFWIPDNGPIFKIPGLDYAPQRMCWLTGLRGVDGAWSNSFSFARIHKVRLNDTLHATPGFYVESNLQNAISGSRPEVHYLCMDFPSDHVYTVGYIAPSEDTRTETITIGSLANIKGCGLTGIQGPFNVDSWTNGVTATWPTTFEGEWTLTVSAGKAAYWTCVQQLVFR